MRTKITCISRFKKRTVKVFHLNQLCTSVTQRRERIYVANYVNHLTEVLFCNLVHSIVRFANCKIQTIYFLAVAVVYR